MRNKASFIATAGLLGILAVGLLGAGQGQPPPGQAQAGEDKDRDADREAIRKTERQADLRFVARLGVQQPKADSDPARAADQAAINKLKQSLIEAFEQGDAAKAAALLTEGAELDPDDAPPLRGRQNIQKAFAEHFSKRTTKAKVEFEPEAIRFLSRDAAIEEGHVKIAKGQAAPTVERYSLLLMREDGKWLLASIKEWPSEEAELKELGWLIGSWEAKQGDVEVHTSYEWFGDKAFIRGNINVTIGGHARSAMQVIGKDPRTDELHIWTFEVGGGMVEGTCTRDGEAWLFHTEGMSADGSSVSNTNILARVTNDIFTWQPVDITVDGEQRTNLPPVKVTRVKRVK
jgi:uncharacterized protein (TIGR02246 family)